MLVQFIVTCLLLKSSVQEEGQCVSRTCQLLHDDVINFILIGDWGGSEIYPYTSDIQEKVARAMNDVSLRENVSFYMSVGDHIYPNGVVNETDPRFQYTFEDAFNETGHQKPWYLIAGNHDYYLNVSAQIAYSKYNERWNFPNYYHSITYQTSTGMVADFIMIDTMILCGNNKNHPDEQPPGPPDANVAEKQWQWIEGKLNQSRANYLFLVGHYPIRSSGRHGPTTACMYKRMENLVLKYNVTAFLSGHDHNLEYYRHVTDSGTQVHNVISGFGAKSHVLRYYLENRRQESMFFYPDNESKDFLNQSHIGGFVFVKLTKSTGYFDYYNGECEKMYSFTVVPRGRCIVNVSSISMILFAQVIVLMFKIV